ncbi:MAG: HAMP domain-containing protein, partial [Methylomonas sp.]
MHKSIRFKLFLILMTTTLLIVAGMYAFTRWSVTQGFSELIASRQQERVNNMIEGLSDYYASHQSWDELAKDKQQWLNLLLQSNPRNIAPNWRTQALAEPGNLWPPAINPEQDKRKFTPLELRVMLLDADKKIVFGREETLPELLLTPIGYQGKIIGYLGLAPGKTVNHVSEISFMERQSESFIWIALIMIALSAFLALLLAYMLGGPLKRITGAVKTLAAGNYAIRLTMDSNDELGHL